MKINCKMIALVGLLALFLSSCRTTHTEKQERPYNVLFIALDDLNDWTGFLGGHPQTQTPHMDRLAAAGMVFRRAYCSTSECNPSRAAAFTGYHAKTTGFTNNFLPLTIRQWQARDEMGGVIPQYQLDAIPDMNEAKTLPQWFREHGYFTMGCGKIYHQHYDPYADTKYSWDKWGRPRGRDLTRRPENKSGICDGFVQWLDWGPDEVNTAQTTDVRRAQWAAQQLAGYDGNEPFFLAVGFKKPHDPFYAPPEFFDRLPAVEDIQLPPIYDNGPTDNDLSDIPTKGKITADKKPGQVSEYEIIRGRNQNNHDYRKEVVHAYLATVAYADHCVGIVMDALKHSAFKDNTIVVLWSDHGWHLGEKLHYHKFTFWEEAIRTPFIIKVPKGKAGHCDRLVNAVDIFPTLVELTGLPQNYLQASFDKQGHSLVPLLHKPDTSWNKPSLTSNYKRFPPMTNLQKGQVFSDQFLSHGLCTERWKLIEYIDNNETNLREYELYDTQRDPNEWRNLAEDPAYQTVKAKLIELIHKHPGGEDGPQQTNTPPSCLPYNPSPGEELPEGNQIRVRVEAMDVDSPSDIRHVRFYQNARLIGTDETYPYECTVTLMESNKIVAVAQDHAGAEDSLILTFDL